MKQVWRELRPLLAYMGLFSFCVNLLYLIPALFMLQVFDRVLTTHSGETLVVLLVGTAVAMVVMLLLDYVRQRLQGVLAAIADERLARPLVESLVERAARTPHAGVGEGMRDLATLKTVLSSNALAALFDAPWAPLFLALIWTFHPVLGLGALVSVALMLALAWLNHRTSRAAIEGLQQDGRRAGALCRKLAAQRRGAAGAGHDRQAAGPLARAAGRGGGAARQRRAQRRGLQRADALRAPGDPDRHAVAGRLAGHQPGSLGRHHDRDHGAAGAGPAAGRAAGGQLARAGRRPRRLPPPGRTRYERSARRRSRCHARPAGCRSRACRTACPAPASRCSTTSRSQLEPGESLAIIGASAAGKSTLARLLIGLWAPATGSVRLDGADVARWDRAQLGQWIGYVPQDVELFDGSVADNIARLAQVDSERVIAAAKRANAHDMILEFAEGYDTLVGEGGMRLSPGQRQRIALARALYGNPRLVVLDEPNANLDGAGELALAHAVNGLRADGVTTIIVTHRPALIAHVTKILVLENGRAKRYGAAAEVMRDMQRQAQAVVDTASAQRPEENTMNNAMTMQEVEALGSSAHGHRLGRLRAGDLPAGAGADGRLGLQRAAGDGGGGAGLRQGRPEPAPDPAPGRRHRAPGAGARRPARARRGAGAGAGRRRGRRRPQPPGLPRAGRTRGAGAPGKRTAARACAACFRTTCVKRPAQDPRVAQAHGQGSEPVRQPPLLARERSGAAAHPAHADRHRGASRCARRSPTSSARWHCSARTWN